MLTCLVQDLGMSTLPALLLFALVASATPGPNTMMIMASGANFGLRRSLPHMLGIALGFTMLILSVGLGLGAVFQTVPGLVAAMTVGAVLYALWLAWKIATAAGPAQGAAGRAPLTFLQAAGFQWVNPKAWAMGTTAITIFAPEGSIPATLSVAAAFLLVSMPSVGAWAALGSGARRWMTAPEHLRWFNRAMALLLLVSMGMVLLA